MKLKSIYVKAYGKLRDYSYEFKDGANVFCEPNGYGKSTISSFIKAMFYGVGRSRVNEKEYSEATHYRPSCNEFGGNLILEHEGDEYRIERNFVNDNATVYKNNELIQLDDVGAYFFGVNKESFERTLYMLSSDVACTSEIKFKLGGSSVAADNYDWAISTITDKIKSYKRDRGGSGSIDCLKRKESELILSIDDERKSHADLEEDKNRQIELHLEIEKLIVEEKKANELRLLEEKRRNYERMQEEAIALKSDLDEMLSAYPNGLPEKEKAEEMEAALARAERLTAQAAECRRSVDLTRYENLFRKGVPTDEQLNDIEKCLSEKIELERAVYNPSIRPEISAKFKGKEPNEEALKLLEKKANDYAQNEEKMKDKMEQPKKKPVLPFVLLAISILAFIGGAASVFFNKIVGIVLFTAGAVVLALSIAFLFLGKKESTVIDPLSVENERLGAEIKAFLSIYGYFSGNLSADLSLFSRDLEEYKKGVVEEAEAERWAAQNKARVAELNETLYPFFSEFGYVEYSMQNLYAIKTALGAYLNALEGKRANDERAKNLEEEADKLRAKDKAFKETYSITCDNKTLIKALDEIKRTRDNLVAAENKANAYKRENAVSDELILSLDYNEIEEKLNESRSKLLSLENEIKKKEASVARAQNAEALLEKTRDEIENAEKEYRILVKCREFLMRAEKNLRMKYVEPIKEKFGKYADELNFADAKKIEFTGDLVPVIADKAQRDIRSASKGEATLYALCYRLALIESVYGSIPFIVLDDPFVALDETNFKAVATALRRLSDHTQILYTTCHSSRMV